jgi:hypothetical protein
MGHFSLQIVDFAGGRLGWAVHDALSGARFHAEDQTVDEFIWQARFESGGPQLQIGIEGEQFEGGARRNVIRRLNERPPSAVVFGALIDTSTN